MQIVFMFLIILYAFCFRIKDLILDKIDGFFESWKDIADFEKILEQYNIKDSLLGLDDFLLSGMFVPFQGNSCCVGSYNAIGIPLESLCMIESGSKSEISQMVNIIDVMTRKL